MKKINVLAGCNGVGLQKDQEILCSILREAGYEVDANNIHEKSLFFKMRGAPQYDLNIFCEHVNPFWFKAAKANWLIPNQEILPPSAMKYLSEFSLIVCKTRYAVEIFNKLKYKTAFTGFTSVDRWRPEIEKNEPRFFHLAGKSPFKGTDALFQAWKENPDLPELIIIENPVRKRIIPQLDNMRYICEYLEDDELQKWQNQCMYHLCPSIAEGFGHYIMEGFSCKKLLLTTDAPPMNELVDTDRGVLCPYQVEAVSCLSNTFLIKPQHLAEKVREMINLPDDQKTTLRENARRFFLENDKLFKTRFLELIHAD